MDSWEDTLIAFFKNFFGGGGGLESTAARALLPTPISLAFSVGNLLQSAFGIFGGGYQISEERAERNRIAGARNRAALAPVRREFGREFITRGEDVPGFGFDFENPAIEAAVRGVLASGIGIADENLGEIANAQLAFEQDLRELEEALDAPTELPTQEQGIDVNPERDTDIQTILTALNVFVNEGPGGLLEDLATGEISPELGSVASTEPEPEPEEEEEKTMAAFNPWGILDVITDVLGSGGFGDVPLAPDLVDIFQIGTGIAGLFNDGESGTAITNGSTAMPLCQPRQMTPLQVVQACARRKTGRSISKKAIKQMARVCGLDQTAVTLGCPVTTICLVITSPTRRRTGISSRDLRVTRATTNKLKRMYMSIPTRGSPRRKSA